MNTNKIIVVLLLVIGVLGGALALQQWLQGQGNQDHELYAQNFTGITQDALSDITLSKGTETLAFKKENNQWKSDQAVIDAQLISALTKSILDPDEVILISQNSEQHGTYAVTDGQAIIVLLTTDNGEKKVYLGSPSSGNKYLRIDGSTDVWGVASLPSQISEINLEDWLDKQLVALDKDQLAALEFTANGRQFSLGRRDDNWYLDNDPRPVDTTSISDVLLQLESLVAVGTISEDALKDFPTTPALKISITPQADSPKTLELFTGKEAIMAKLSDRSGNFEISQSVFDDLNIKREQITFATQPTPAEE